MPCASSRSSAVACSAWSSASVRRAGACSCSFWKRRSASWRGRRRRRRPEGMRQISTATPARDGLGDLGLHRCAPAPLMQAEVALAHDSRTALSARRRAAPTDAAQARSHPAASPPRALTRTPPPSAASCHPQLQPCRRRGGQEHDLGAPPQPVAVLLGLVRDQARGLQVIQPPLHAAAVCPHEPRTRGTVARDLAPAHHRRQPRDQLPDRRREPGRALCVPEPEDVALDRVRARLEPIVTRRRAPAGPSRTTQQGVDHQPPGLERQRLGRRPIPTTRRPSGPTSGCAVQRHRQRPKAPRQRSAARRRADARGTAGTGVRSRAAGALKARRIGPAEGD